VNAVAKLSKKAKRILAPHEKFLVLEVTPHGTNALFLGVDEEHNLIFEKEIDGADLVKFLRSPFRRLTQKSWEGNYLFKTRRKVIVSADPSLATTMPVPLDLVRDRARWKDEVTLEELENLIAQAMQKIFTQCRSEAAKRLAVDDIHTILVGAKADRFKIDNHAVMNPVGFTCRKISLLLELTFATRDVFENLKQFFNSPDEFFFIEAPQAWALSLSRVRKLPLNLIAANPKGGSTLFIFQNAGAGAHPVLYREKFEWSFDSIFRLIMEEFGVDIERAHDLYHAYHAGTLSGSAARGFRRAIRPSIEALEKEIERAKVTGFVYIDTLHPLPFAAPHKHKRATFEILPASEILAELGLQADDDPSMGVSARSFRRVAPFLEAYFAKTTSEINQKLRRRLHWLAD